VNFRKKKNFSPQGIMKYPTFQSKNTPQEKYNKSIQTFLAHQIKIEISTLKESTIKEKLSHAK
jgi:hypothetical protein